MTEHVPAEKEIKIYLAIWRHAMRTNAPVEIKLKSNGQALSMRMAMYRAMKHYRENPMLDPELTKASEVFAISVEKGSKSLWLRERKSLGAAKDAMEQLGLSEDDLMTPGEQAIKQRIEAELGEVLHGEPEELAADPLIAANPFYSADER